MPDNLGYNAGVPGPTSRCPAGKDSSMADAHPDPLRVAVIGTGFGSRVQLPGFLSEPDTLVVALCGRDEAKTVRIADQFGVKAVYTDYHQMIEDVEPDLVSIAAPTPLHAPMARAALRAGAHVLCEAPLACSAEEAEELLRAAGASGRVHVVDHLFRYLPARYYQRVLFDQGYVGEPLLLEATLFASWHWERAPMWGGWDAPGGGVWNAFGPHALDAFRWLSGREVRAVSARLCRARPEHGSAPSPDDTASAVVELEGGLQGMITLSAAAGGETQRLAVHGSEGALVVQDDLQLWGRRRGEPLEPIDVPQEYDPPLWVPLENTLLGPFVKLLGLMVDRIYGRGIVAPPTFEDGLAVQRALDAGVRSSREGRRVEIS